ncbi:hypothetical protein CDAR_302491 [Caerostris darwini]|uniref:Uncharacterized protein n=1 Tax=Caerostris darwini TaxID=1538125 RepID=A0AAV4NFE7_9ARAC|nr:hypothetical protein CDAR_302491 [Caerostris darwini]
MTSRVRHETLAILFSILIGEKKKEKERWHITRTKNRFGNSVAIPGWDRHTKAFHRILPDFLQADIDSWHHYPRREMDRCHMDASFVSGYLFACYNWAFSHGPKGISGCRFGGPTSQQGDLLAVRVLRD